MTGGNPRAILPFSAVAGKRLERIWAFGSAAKLKLEPSMRHLKVSLYGRWRST